MKYSLDCYIKTNSSEIRNAVKQLILSIDDSKVWGVQYDYSEFEDLEDGTTVFSCTVRFNIKTDRDAVAASIKGLNNINACEDGSFVRKHKCYHDETPPKPCEEETILRKE